MTDEADLAGGNPSLLFTKNIEQLLEVEPEAGTATAGVSRKHGISSATFLQLEGKVRWLGDVGRQAAEGAGKREHQAKEVAG